VTPDGERLVISSVDGPGTQALLGVSLSVDTSRSAEVMRTGASEAIADLALATNVPAEVTSLDLGPGLYVPLVADGRRLGTLVLARAHGRPQFEQLDIAFAELFANSIAAAIENGEVRAELERLGIASEHERIAFDLHDTVIQELFGIGMSLQAARSMITGRGVERVDAAVESLDNVIREIRNTIFRLPTRPGDPKGVRDETLRIIDKFVEELGFTPRIAFRGPVDTAVPELVTGHLTQVFTESISNVARHANATSVEIIIEVSSGWLEFTCIDNGSGLDGQPSAGNGLQNMKARATNLGGTCELTNRSPSGTTLVWRVPV
jgi:signal transduction histidine kinase